MTQTNPTKWNHRLATRIALSVGPAVAFASFGADVIATPWRFLLMGVLMTGVLFGIVLIATRLASDGMAEE
jgi:hypothetical protein